MKKIKKLSYLFFFGLSALGYSQVRFIAQEVTQVSKKYPQKEAVNNIISEDTHYYNTDVQKSITSYKVYNYNVEKAIEIIKEAPEFISLQIQNEKGEFWTLDLVNSSHLLSDLSVITGLGKDFDFRNFKAAFYRGIIRGDEESLVSISLFENEISGFISNEKGNYVIGKIKDTEKIILYNDKNLTEKPTFDCSMPNLFLSKEEINNYGNVNNRSAATALTAKCVRLYFETEYDIFQNKGSVANVVTYVTNLYNQSATLYANDGVSTTLSQIKVWDTVDPYNATSSSGLLTEFQNQTSSINGTLGQLLTFRSIGGGIAAGFNGICNANVDNSLCVSGNLEATFPNVPTYSWSVMVVTHEFGHLFGSRHTHACVWNGNNTAIDGCAGYVEGSCSLPGIPSVGGTIMSYCHIQSVGINFSNGFGPQPASVIVNNVNNGSCLTSCGSPCPTSLTITAPVTTTDTQQASSSINALNTVNSGATAVYHAGDEVLLSDGFTALNGSVFRSYIEGCTGNYVAKTTNTREVITYDLINKNEVNEAIQNNVDFYPNPNNGIFEVRIKDESIKNYTLRVVSAGNREVLRKKVNGENPVRIDISRELSGVYIVTISAESGKVISKKIIKK